MGRQSDGIACWKHKHKHQRRRLVRIKHDLFSNSDSHNLRSESISQIHILIGPQESGHTRY